MYATTHSYFSLRYGTLSEEDLATIAKQHGFPAVALTDINCSTGIFPFVKACQEQNIQPIAGIEFRKENRWLYTGIAKNEKGFQELNEYLSFYSLNEKPLPEIARRLEYPKFVKEIDFDNVFLIYPLNSRKPETLKAYEYLGVQPSEVNKTVLSASKKLREKLVIHAPMTYINAEGQQLHKHLRAIDNNILLSQLQTEHGLANDAFFKTIDQLKAQYEMLPGIWENTEKILQQCSFTFDFHQRRNKQSFTGDHYDDKMLLEKLAWDGLRNRYGAHDKVAAARVKHELDIIDKLGFAAYFLITWDVIRYSMSRGFYHVGRGSGANSVVAYCLHITDVDPIQLDLYFERFLNPKRTSPPDFDIDYSWDERDEVIDYIFKRYGREHTALMGAMSTFQENAAMRELGKVYGLPKTEIDALVKNPDDPLLQNAITKNIKTYSALLQDFPNVRSIHAGGILISEQPLTCFTALDMPPKGFQTVQWDMYTAEAIGFEKLDILSQRGIGHIKECVQLVRQNKGLKIDAHEVEKFKQDEQVKKQLASGDTIGCFYIESPSMRGLLSKLRCDNYLTLVAASSIIRPGVAKSGMMREYIQRFHHPEKIRHIHPVLGEQLQETFGVMVYQEDVLKVCHHFAGLDLADADVLRRGMSGKYRSKSEFQKLVDKFFHNCREKGYPDSITKEVWRQVESFAGYSFSKAHSASFAVESYQSLYLKAHYPLEFMVAVINNFGGFYRTWVYVNECRKAGGNVLLPCVNHSQHLTSVTGQDVYLGFIHIESLEQKIAFRIVQEREKNGPYSSLHDLISRAHLSLEAAILLVRINALRFTGRNKKELLWEAHQLLNNKPAAQETCMFQVTPKEFHLPTLSHCELEDAFDEMELLGFPVSITPFGLLKTEFRGEIMAMEMLGNVGKKVRMVGNLVCTKYVRTVRGEIMQFGTFLDAESGFFDTVHFPPSLKNYPFKGMGMYLILGKITEEFGFASLEVEKLGKLPFQSDPRY